MSSELVTTGTVEDGRLTIRNKAALREALRGMRDGEVTLTIERKHATRSLSQNAYYWGVVVCRLHERLEDDGWTEDDVHDFLKAKFIPKKLSVVDGNGEVKDEFVVGGTTTRLNKTEFGDYMNAIRQWAAEELDLNIPDPEGGLSA